MHRQVDSLLNQTALDRASEQSFTASANISNRSLLVVTTGLDDFDFELQVRPPRLQRIHHQSGLPQREFAPTRAHHNFDPAWTFHHFPVAAVYDRRKRAVYNSDARSDPSPAAGCSAVPFDRVKPRAIDCSNSATCWAMISSAAAICSRRMANDCAAIDCNESIS